MYVDPTGAVEHHGRIVGGTAASILADAFINGVRFNTPWLQEPLSLDGAFNTNLRDFGGPWSESKVASYAFLLLSPPHTIDMLNHFHFQGISKRWNLNSGSLE